MKLQVMYFAAVRDLVERDREQIDIAESRLQVKGLVAHLMRSHPRLQMDGVRVAVNEEFVEMDHHLDSGDVVALIPPVSGG